MGIARTLTKAAAATVGVGLVITLAAGTAGADVGAPTEEQRAGAKISLTNAVITGVVDTTTAMNLDLSKVPACLLCAVSAGQTLSISNSGGGTL